MKILHFALGACFNVIENGELTPARLWEGIFSVLTAEDVAGMELHGGMAHSVSGEEGTPFYVCVFNGGNLKRMRKVYQKLSGDAGVSRYLSETHPFLQSNALEKIEGLIYYGKAEKNGELKGGEAPFFSVNICEKRSKRPLARQRKALSATAFSRLFGFGGK